MRDEIAKDNGQTAAWITHDLTLNNGLVFSSTRNLNFNRFQILQFFSRFRLWYHQRIDMNDILRKSDVKTESDTARQRV